MKQLPHRYCCYWSIWTHKYIRAAHSLDKFDLLVLYLISSYLVSHVSLSSVARCSHFAPPMVLIHLTWLISNPWLRTLCADNNNIDTYNNMHITFHICLFSSSMNIRTVSKSDNSMSYVTGMIDLIHSDFHTVWFFHKWCTHTGLNTLITRICRYIISTICAGYQAFSGLKFSRISFVICFMCSNTNKHTRWEGIERLVDGLTPDTKWMHNLTEQPRNLCVSPTGVHFSCLLQ